MTLNGFQNKLDELRVKSGMREDVFWPIVYDEDEIGEIFISENGRIFFADKLSNWVQSHLTVESVSNIRYKSINSANKTERDIYINFDSGDFIKIHNWKKNSIIYTSVSMLKTEENGEYPKNEKSPTEPCIHDSIGRWHEWGDSEKKDVDAVKPASSICPPDICI